MTVKISIETVHGITYALLALGLLFWVLWARKYKNQRLYAIAPISYIMNTVLFYIAEYTHSLEIVDINLWSAIIRLHGVLLITILAMILHGNGGSALWTRKS